MLSYKMQQSERREGTRERQGFVMSVKMKSFEVRVFKEERERKVSPRSTRGMSTAERAGGLMEVWLWTSGFSWIVSGLSSMGTKSSSFT